MGRNQNVNGSVEVGAGGTGVMAGGAVGMADGGRRRNGYRRRSRRRRGDGPVTWFFVALGWAIIVALPLTVIWFCASSAIAKHEAEQAVAQAKTAVSAVRQGDGKATAAAIDALGSHIRAVHGQTEQPVWWMMQQMPVVGGDVASLRQSVDVLDDVARNVVPHLSSAVSRLSVKDFGVSDGVIRMPGLADSAKDLVAANEAFARADAAMQEVSEPRFDALAKLVDQAKQLFDQATDGLDTVSRIAQVMPPMLDLDGAGGGSRTYLLLAQNNAELRATGGIPGSWGTMTVSDGGITLNGFVSDADLQRLDEPATTLTSDERHLFSDKLGRIAQDVTFTPDFSRTGTIAKAMWEKQFGGNLDGVISLDPVLLQRLLEVAGPVEVDAGDYKVTLDGKNATRVLLSDVYRDLPVEQQDPFFALAAGKAFDKLLHDSDLDLVKVATALGKAAQDGHLYVWSAHEDEQEALEDSVLSGALPRDEASSVAGLFFNDSVESKMGWYLKRDVSFSFERKLNDGRRQYVMDVTLTNTLKPEQVGSVPQYVLGSNADGSAPGDVGEVMFVYAPAGGSLMEWTFPDGSDFNGVTVHDSLTVGQKYVRLKPGESYRFQVRFLSSAAASDTPMRLRVTPQAQ